MSEKLSEKEIQKMIKDLNINIPNQITMGLRKKSWRDRLYLFCHKKGISPNDVIYSILDRYMEEELNLQEDLFDEEIKRRKELEALRKKQNQK